MIYMKRFFWLLLLVLLFSACQPKTLQVFVREGEQVNSFTTHSNIPGEILAEGGLTLDDGDRLLYLGAPVSLTSTLPGQGPFALEIRRTRQMTLITPEGEKQFQSSALTVGQALTEAGYVLYLADLVDPPAGTPLDGVVTITYRPARPIEIQVDGRVVYGRSAAQTVGEALAEAGVPLVGLDMSQPQETEPMPADGLIRVVRVAESVALTQKTIPYQTRSELSAELEIDQQALLQGGEPGLAMSRVRTRSEDGVQVSQVVESESLVRPPQDEILGIGTKIVIRTTTVDGVTIEYWRTLRLYATSYSPCRAMRPDGKCGTSTSSGLKPGYGVVAMQYYWYLLFGFEHLYIPGYGPAVVGDVGGAYITSHYWIDLGYDDDNYVEWGDWVTVYFLTPVPADPGYILP